MGTSFRCHDYVSSTPATTITAGGTLDLAGTLTRALALCPNPTALALASPSYRSNPNPDPNPSNAGTLDLAWELPANHPGDCSLWISYDARQ